ncbi:NAD(P)/FAD-dependent oxidoreductase [Mesorhizobium sp. LHD-90]|uniref:flavin monoamine oxidase family protein n=1 Tax=Mesorhizobium sp. LHD-90 TaxID=3071414 RepID=UPI0027E13D56|nr:NAD(P)/FAD-dependent oxidoreductase [Mesorhizobium sp. LHD-90]MDQ6434059.1 NAD(P)/FAD-dependent oxidoreductase [Mesorhizobium sp. LHD-90]
MEDVDVVIVGAGSSGLAAAKILRAAGLTFRVFEAMGRIGGRAFTSTEHFGIPFDIGCAWLHAADRNPYFPEAEAGGWTLHHHDMNVDHLYFGKHKASESDEADMKLADQQLATLMELWAGTDDRVSSLLASGHAPRAAATFAGPMDFGKDFDEISIEDFRAAADLDPNYYSFEGFGALVARFGADVPVELATPVRKILWDVPGIACVTDRGTIRAKAVIVTASPAALAFEEIEFRPELPAAHTQAFFDLPMGMLTKLPIEIRGTRLGLSPFDDLLIERRARNDIYFLCFPFDTELMVGFVGGDFAWEISAAGEAAGVDFVTDRLCDIFGSDLRKHVGRAAMTNWGGERFVRGAYAAARPGKSAARATLMQPVAERIFFAGEHLAGPLIQTCGGARLSGEAVARQVVAQLAGASGTIPGASR